MLDTAYLLPAIGISVKKISSEDVLESLNKANEAALCEITIFELCAKAAKYVSAGMLEAGRVSRGIQAIINDDSIIKLRTYDSRELSTAFKLRAILGDFIDCLILATAMNQADRLLTEDRDIHDLKRNERFKELVKSANPKFEILTLSEDLLK